MRTLVLGFDGASPRLVDKWIDRLPTFNMFKERGSWGLTIPPIPAQTPVAWTTFATGQNPGNHGIFSFAFRHKGSYERKVIDPELIRSKTLWRILSDCGKRIGVVNVPMCDSMKVRGFIIPGFLSRTEGVFPPPIKEILQRRFHVDRLMGDLDVDTLKMARSNPELFFERVNHITDEMAEICLHLIKEEKWDFFMAVFMGADRIQHFFWKYVDEDHPEYEETLIGELVEDFYIKLDRIVSRFLEGVPEDICVIVLSDHGFCPIHKEIIINDFLQEMKFLETDEIGKIDLERSRAISYGYGDIWLNVRGREPKGIIGSDKDYEDLRVEISEELKRIKVDGGRPILDVKKREQIYWGSYVDRAPDLTTIFDIGWQAARQPEITKRSKLKRYVNDNPLWSGGHDGTHDPAAVPGIIGVLGPEMRKERELRVRLSDVAPTILGLMGIAAPTEMDGKPFY